MMLQIIFNMLPLRQMQLIIYWLPTAIFPVYLQINIWQMDWKEIMEKLMY